MERAKWLTQDDLPLYEVAVFADAQLPTESHCNLVRAFLYMGWLHQPNQHEPVPNSEVEQAITKTFAQNSVRPMKFDSDMGTKSITNVSAETCQNLLPEL